MVGHLHHLSRTLFAESGKAYSMRQLATIGVLDYLRAHRLPWCSIAVELDADVLRVRVRLWWPWLCALGLVHLGYLLWARRVVLRHLDRIQVPMRKVFVRVQTRRSRPRR